MRSVLSSLIAITLASGLSAAEPPRYQLVDIGSLNGFSTFATDVNERGVVVGYSQLGDAPPHSEPAAHAVLYQNGALTDLFDGSSVTVAVATAVNDAGHVVGFLREDALGPTQPWLDAGAGVVILDPFDVGLPFAITGSANGVNQSGQIAGSASGRAFLLTPPATTGVDLTPGPPAPYFGSSASALNDAGHVVGTLSKPGTWPLLDTADSFLHDGSSLVNLDEILSGQYPDANFVPSAISEAGVAVGHAYGPSLPVSAVTYESGFFAVLPTLGGDRGRAHDIDSVGRVVGDSTLPGDSSPRAVLWDGGEVYDLNDYVPAGSGMVLAVATASNEHGQIVVQGHAASDPYPPQTWHSFLLTPWNASNAIEELIDIIEGMGLHHGIENSLVVKLEHALSDVLAGDDAGACDHLSSFVNQVEAQSGKKISIAEAEELLDRAASIQSLLGCAP